jgi:multicomponent Na+:H+ antiporter subunit D
MADLAVETSRLAEPRAGMLTAASMVLLVVFALKAAAFPLFFWLPDSYPIVPLGVNGFFAGLLTKVGIYSLLRVFVMTFRQPGNELALHVLLVSSAFTMVVGVLGALCQWEIRRVLSWHIISQVGYMVMGIGLAGDAGIATAAVAATIFYVVHHIVVKASLFLLGGVAEEISGSGRLKEMGGVALAAPGAAALFFVAALSLAGMPPFSGFLAKLVLVRTALRGSHGWIVGAAVATSFLTLLSMMKIWNYAFWGNWHDMPPRPLWRRMAAPVSVLVAATVLLGVFAQPFLRLASDAARGIVEPVDYVRAVLGPEAAMALRPTALHVAAATGEQP